MCICLLDVSIFYIKTFSVTSLWDGPYDAPYRRPYICGRRTANSGRPYIAACDWRTAYLRKRL